MIRVEELPFIEPIEAYKRLPIDLAGCVVLHSGFDPLPQHIYPLARFCFFAIEPFAQLSYSIGGNGVLVKLRDKSEQIWDVHPFISLRRFWQFMRESLGNMPDMPTPLPCGLIGYLGYDLRVTIERLPFNAIRDLPIPDMWFGAYGATLTWDLRERKLFAIATGLPETGRNADKLSAYRMEHLLKLLEREPVHEFIESTTKVPLFADMTPSEYYAAVERIKAYIASGDVYQVNFAHRFRVPVQNEPHLLFLRLCHLHPAPFIAFINLGDFANNFRESCKEPLRKPIKLNFVDQERSEQSDFETLAERALASVNHLGKVCVICDSPERFLHFDASTRIAHTRPIKGTRPRGKTQDEDAKLAEELLASEKDKAEHIMIVDLERNDLGRVAEIGSVNVSHLYALEPHPTIWHLVSTVEAKIPQGKDAIDILFAMFPGGSITGAPKIRAMEIIDEVEPVARGIYTGSIGYWSVTGDCDFNIVIRTAIIWDKWAHFHVGGGIVADSDQYAEYEETLAKAQGLLRMLGCSSDAKSIPYNEFAKPRQTIPKSK